MNDEGDSPKQEAGTSGNGIKKSRNKKSPKKGKMNWPTLVRPSKHFSEDEEVARPKKKPRVMEGLMEDLLEDEDTELDIDDDSTDEPKDSVLSSVANELAEKIATNAAKTNLSATNVKSILHHLLTDKMLLEFAQRVALDAPEANVESSSTFDHGTRLTRSRWKQNKGITQKEPQIFDAEFETEDSEDEEYDPENESMITHSDDESIPTPFSDQPSPSLPRTPDSRLSTIKELEIEQSTLTDLNEDGEPIFKVPGTPLSAGKPKFLDETEEEIIASRTRSKISMKDLSLEELTASLEPPDYDPALYDYLQPDELDHDDLEWQNWLKGLFTQEDDDETAEENDEDFNFMAFEEELDQEEFRYDKAVKVTQKELQDLLDGILDDFGETVEDKSSILKYVIPQYSITYAQKQQLIAQLQQHTQLLAQTYVLCYRESYLKPEATWSKELLQELANFRKAVDEDEILRDNSAYCYDGLEEAIRFVDSVHNTSELEEILAREDEATQRPKKISKKIRSHFCVDMPPRIGLKILSEPYLATYPELIPEQGAMAFDKQIEMEKELRIKFYKSEDNLIALGMSQFGKDFALIAKHMMPIATVKQIATRAQNLASKREDFWNPVKLYWKTKQLPALKTAVCVNNPRTISTKSIKENYRMLSYVHRLPLWIDRLCEHLGRLDVINLKKQQQTFALQYPKVFQFAAIAPKEMPVQEKIELNLPKKPKRRRNRRKKRDQIMILSPSRDPYPVQSQLVGQNQLPVTSDGQNPVRSPSQNSVSSHDESLVQTSVHNVERSPDLVCSPNRKPVHVLDQCMRSVMKLEQKKNTSKSPVQIDSWAQSGGHVSDPVQSVESHDNGKSSSTLNMSRTETAKTGIPTTEVPTTESQTSTEVEMVLNPRKSMQRIRTWRVQQPFDPTPRVTKISQGVQTCETTSQGVQTGKEFVEIPSPTKQPRFVSTQTQTESVHTADIGVPETNVIKKTVSTSTQDTGIGELNIMRNTVSTTTEDIGIPKTSVISQTDAVNAANTGITESNFALNNVSAATEDTGIPKASFVMQTDLMNTLNTGIAESNFIMDNVSTATEHTKLMESDFMTANSMSILDTGVRESGIITNAELTSTEDSAITDSDAMAPEAYDSSDEGESACSMEALHGDDTDDMVRGDSHCEIDEPYSPEVPFNPERVTTGSQTPVKLNLPVATDTSESEATVETGGSQTAESLLRFTNFLSKAASTITSSAIASTPGTSSTPSSPVYVPTCTVSVSLSPFREATEVTLEESEQFSKDDFMNTISASTSNLKTPEYCNEGQFKSGTNPSTNTLKTPEYYIKGHFMSTVTSSSCNLQEPEYCSKEDIIESKKCKNQLFTTALTIPASLPTQVDSSVVDIQRTRGQDCIAIAAPAFSQPIDVSGYVEAKELPNDMVQNSEGLISTSDVQVFVKATERIESNTIGTEKFDERKFELEAVNKTETCRSEDTDLWTENKVVLNLNAQNDFNIHLASDAESMPKHDSTLVASRGDINLANSVFISEETDATSCPGDRTLSNHKRRMDFDCNDDVDNKAQSNSPIENKVKSQSRDDDEAAPMPHFDLELEPSPIHSNPESGNCSYDEDGFVAEGPEAEVFEAEGPEDETYNEEVGHRGQEKARETEQSLNDSNVLKEVNEAKTSRGETSRRNSVTEENYAVEDIHDKESREDVENKDPKSGRKESPKESSTGRSVANPRRKSKGRKSTFNWEEKLQEKASKFADLYFEKVKEALTEKPILYCDFLKVIDEAGKLGTNRVEVFWKLSELLKDYPELIEMFVGFLDPAQAREVGQFKAWLEFDKAINFLLSCEACLVKTKYYHELLRKAIELKETGKDSKTFIDAIRPLFRGNDELVTELTTMFPDLPPPKRRGEDFEIIQYRPEMNGFDHVDNFEEVKLLPSDYIVNEDPQNRKKTILDDFAGWLQKPALKAVDMRTESTEIKKNDTVSCLVKNDSKRGKVFENDSQTAVLDRPNVCIGEGTSDGKSQGSQGDMGDLTCSSMSAPAQGACFDTVYGVSEISDNDCGIIANLSKLKSAELHQNFIDTGELSVTRQIGSRPQLLSSRADSRLLDLNEADEFATKGDVCGTFVLNRSGSPHLIRDGDLDTKSPEFNPPLKRTLKKGMSRLRIKSDSAALKRSEKMNTDPTNEQCGSPDILVTERQRHILGASPLSCSDSTPKQTDKSSENIRETIHCQISPLCATKTPGTLNSRFLSPLQRKINSSNFNKLGSPLGTKLTTFRLNVSNPEQTSGFQKIDLNEVEFEDNNTEGRVSTSEVSRVHSRDRHMTSPDINMIRTEGQMIQSTDHMNQTSGHMIRTEGHMIQPSNSMNQTSGHVIRTEGQMIQLTDHMNQTGGHMIRTEGSMIQSTDHMNQTSVHMIRTEGHMIQPSNYMNQTSGHMPRADSNTVEPNYCSVEPTSDMVRAESHMTQPNNHVNQTIGHMIRTDSRTFQPDDDMINPTNQFIPSATSVFQSNSDTIQSDDHDIRSDSHTVGHDSGPSSVGSSFAGTNDADCSDNSDDSGDNEVLTSDPTSRTTLSREDGSSPAMSAGDVSYDESGRVIAKWSRDDDRVILTSCRQNGATDSTFEEIAENLSGRTKAEVKQRFLKLMDLLSAAQKK